MKLEGVAEWMAAVDGMVASMDAAARKSLSQAAFHEKKTIRASMTGAPRWVHHHNEPRSGGPGQITGKLMRSVGYTKIERLAFGHYSTTLKAKRKYATKTEGRYPYFTPGVRASEPEVGRIFERNYAAAVLSGGR